MIPALLPEISRRMMAAPRALDVGGWNTQMNAATHVVDHLSYETRMVRSHDPWNTPRFSAATWLQRDICDRQPWPFPDKFFDFCMCSHVLEDVRDPLWVLSELARVASAGYLETPKPEEELLTWKKAFRPGKIGAAHHRWFVAFRPEESLVEFRMKPYDLYARGLTIRYWTEVFEHDYAAFNQGMIWTSTVRGVELPYSAEASYEYVASLREAARRLVRFAPMRRIGGKLRRVLTATASRAGRDW